MSLWSVASFSLIGLVNMNFAYCTITGTRSASGDSSKMRINGIHRTVPVPKTINIIVCAPSILAFGP